MFLLNLSVLIMCRNKAQFYFFRCLMLKNREDSLKEGDWEWAFL